MSHKDLAQAMASVGMTSQDVARAFQRLGESMGAISICPACNAYRRELLQRRAAKFSCIYHGNTIAWRTCAGETRILQEMGRVWSRID